MAALTEMKKDPAQPGLWVNQKWTPGTPGLYAVVIGTSVYKHLGGGTDPAPESYGLPQLAVSALTAFRIYQWLTHEYYVKDCPLAKCWLLLEGTQGELDYEPELKKHLSAATFNACEMALGFWHSELQQVAPTAGKTSRSFFFFSGHGLEAHEEDQILLPSDYLAPPNRNITKALSTRNLQAALASSPVPRQFFYVDACRNDQDDLRRKGLAGTKILTEDEPAKRNKELIAPVLYATSTGSQAWQQPSPNAGLSLFGQALLNGFRGQPNLRLECDGNLCSVQVYSLQPFVEKSVLQQLAAANSTYGQPVRLGGSSRNEDITFLRASSTGEPPDVPVRPAPQGAPLTGETAVMEFAAIKETTIMHRSQVTTNTAAWATHYNIGHDIFAREPVTAIWSKTLRVYAIGRKQEVDPNDFKLESVTLDRSRTGYRINLTFLKGDPKGFWVELQDHSGRWFGAILPTEQQSPLKYLLEKEMSPDGTRILEMRARLGDNNGGQIDRAAALWLRYQTGDLDSALSKIDAGQLEDLVFGKAQAPLAATIAAMVLLRANRLDVLPIQWLQNLTNWFEQYSDAAVLLAERHLREGRAREAIDSILILQKRELPFTSECTGYALAMLDRFDGLKQNLNETQQTGLTELTARLKKRALYYRSGGLFVVLTGTPADPRPWPAS